MIEHERMIRLTGNDSTFLREILENPPAPTARLRRAFQKYKNKEADAARSIFALKL